MGLFNRAQPSDLSARSQRESDRPLAAVTGDGFAFAIRDGSLPPAGWTFANRFLRGDPYTWQDELRAQMPEGGTVKEIVTSVLGVRDVLQQYEQQGAPLPMWQAAEEAVTLTLTAYVATLAEVLAKKHPEDFRTRWDGGQVTNDGWFRPMDAGLWLLCEELREAAQAAEVEAFRRDPMPSEMVGAVIGAVFSAFKRLEGEGLGSGPTLP